MRTGSIWASLLAVLLLALGLLAPACDAQCALPHAACHVAADCSMHPAQAHIHAAPMTHVCAPDLIAPGEQNQAAPPVQAHVQAVPLALAGWAAPAHKPAPPDPAVPLRTPLRI